MNWRINSFRIQEFQNIAANISKYNINQLKYVPELKNKFVVLHYFKANERQEQNS